MLSRYVQVPTPTWLLCGGGLTFDFKSSKNIRPCSRVIWNRSIINMYLNNLTYIYQLFSLDILKHRIKPFLRRRSGHPSADEDLHRHESHSGRRAADDGRHGESRDPPGDSNDTGSGRGPWCCGGGGMGWVLSTSCREGASCLSIKKYAYWKNLVKGVLKQ